LGETLLLPEQHRLKVQNLSPLSRASLHNAPLRVLRRIGLKAIVCEPS
jgi:uncharacterized protein YjeT (DUF2065 family)